ncbi:hypothetical protein POTOM_021111 [Populus tomentosa]|uniref:Rhodanese domain-containing protein n=1 Tax=Populus tomentosa TaxID=118781 RepID=A0A8X8D2S3_POPTO|nr:hypothetical protein POTOM_021111 [Populus tomentosa]
MQVCVPPLPSCDSIGCLLDHDTITSIRGSHASLPHLSKPQILLITMLITSIARSHTKQTLKKDYQAQETVYTEREKMAAKAVVCYGSSTSSTTLRPVLCPQQLNKRGVFAVNSRRSSININHKSLSFRPKTSLRWNLEATGIPTSVPVRVAHELHQAGHRYLDVRTPDEFSAGHAAGAINIPYMYRVGTGNHFSSTSLQFNQIY